MDNGAELIAEVLNSYKAAVYRKDVEGFAALYDQNVHVFDMWGQWECKGIESWRAMAADWFGSLGSERVVVGVAHIQGHTSGELAAGHAFLTFTAVSEDGTELRSLSNRITLQLRKVGSSWRVVHEHTSAPVDFATMKAILQREQSAA